jgi:dTDP-4-amino-4,6-dideoxygalactose transaminase
MFNAYDIVSELEKRVADYAGAPYAVAVDSCTNAILLSLKYHFSFETPKTIGLPAFTYVGVAYAVLNSGGICQFVDSRWNGAYRLLGTMIIDSARRFRRDMYRNDSLYCLSCHWGKHLKIGRGGFILTDDENAYNTLKRMRYDGRRAGVAPKDDNFDVPGFHCYMLPEEAARGLRLMDYIPDDNPDLPWDDYVDLRQFPIFQRGYVNS